jgi:hypothetical protein
VVPEEAEPASELIAWFGDRAVQVVGGETRTAINDLDRAKVVVPEGALESPVDYLAPLILEVDGHKIFEGSVTVVATRADETQVYAQSGAALTEQTTEGFEAQQFPVQDAVYAMVREAGFDDDHIEIHGLNDLPLEMFEVMVGVDGIDPQGGADVGRVRFVGMAAAATLMEGFDPTPSQESEFLDAPAFALFCGTASRMYDAEASGLSEIDVVLSWLAARNRVGLSHLPDGSRNRFLRSRIHASPSRRGIVAVRGLITRRRWLRTKGNSLTSDVLELGPLSQLRRPELPSTVSFATRQCLLSARRALADGDPIQRAQALWEAFEFFLTDVPVPATLALEERKELLEVLRERMPKRQHDRVANLVDMISKPSPLKLLCDTLIDEGVPLSDEERDLLARLRQARNRATHGDDMMVPTREELDRGCGIIGRALAYRFQTLQDAAI